MENADEKKFSNNLKNKIWAIFEGVALFYKWFIIFKKNWDRDRSLINVEKDAADTLFMPTSSQDPVDNTPNQEEGGEKLMSPGKVFFNKFQDSS